MKKEYQKPEVEIIVFDAAEAIFTNSCSPVCSPLTYEGWSGPVCSPTFDCDNW